MNQKKHFEFGWIIVGLQFRHPCFDVRRLVFVLRLLRRPTEGIWLEPFRRSRGIFTLHCHSKLCRSLCGSHGRPLRTACGDCVGIVDPWIGLALSSTIRAWWHFYLFFGVITAIGLGTTGWIANTTIVHHWFSREERFGGRDHLFRNRCGHIGLHSRRPGSHQPGGMASDLSGHGIHHPSDQHLHGCSFLEKASAWACEEALPPRDSRSASHRQRVGSRSWTVKRRWARSRSGCLTFSFLVSGISNHIHPDPPPHCRLFLF